MRAILAAILALTPTIATSEHILGGADISNGEAVYAEACAACHGADLEGQPDWQTPGADGVMPAPPHDKAGHTWHHDSQLLFDYTKFGGQAALEAVVRRQLWRHLPKRQPSGRARRGIRAGGAGHDRVSGS